MHSPMRLASSALCAVAGLFMTACTAAADAVTLSYGDGGFQLSGRLLGYDGDVYRVDTVYGVLTLNANGVTCGGVACPDPGPYVADLMFSGAAGASAGVMPALLEAYAEELGLRTIRQTEDGAHFLYILHDPARNVDVARIRFRVTSSAEGFADLLAETANIALSFREPTEIEKSRALDAGLGNMSGAERSGVLALDALVAVVSPENQVESIRLDDLARVLSGDIRSWSQLGGVDAPIALNLPQAGSALDVSLQERLLGEGTAVAPEVQRHADMAALDAAVTADQHALGITAFSGHGAARLLPIEGACGFRVLPNQMSIKTEDYPLTAPHFMYTPDLKMPVFLRNFIDFTQSSSAQEAIRETGYVDQSIEFLPLGTQGDRLSRAILKTGRDVTAPDLRRVIKTLEDAAQMSLTFRFQDGSADLDTPSRANVELLAGAIDRGEFAGKTIVLAGFTDGQGGGAANRNLSLRRAGSVRDALLAVLPEGDLGVEIVAEGFGEAMPVACDEDAWGRSANRRVEVWVTNGG